MNHAIQKVRRRSAFTLVELLVVIAIIGILVGMLLPAIGAVRDNARRTENSNNLRSIGQAIQTYEQAKKMYPPLIKVHDEDRKKNRKLRDCAFSTSWAFELLPFLDQQVMYDKHDPTAACWQEPTADPPLKSNLVAFRTPLTVYANPRRRDASNGCPFADRSERGTCIDYAANGGYVVDSTFKTVPLKTKSEEPTKELDPSDPVDGDDELTKAFDSIMKGQNTPMRFSGRTSGPFSLDFNARISTANVRDGVSNVIAAGDRHLSDAEINQPIYDEAGLAGSSLWTIVRFANLNRDTQGVTAWYPWDNANDRSPYKFGTPRGADSCFVFLDGHVRWIPYDTDLKTMIYLSVIADGQVVSPDQ
jgi:prepilin-type N-terminal cleavage/methylation domain-containing protein